MASQNLMPAYRHGAKQRRRRLRRWVTICGAYTALLLAGYGVAESVWGSDGRAITEESERVKLRIASAGEQIAKLQDQLLRAQRLQAANRVLSDQPDWSLLLALLSKTLEDDIVLRTCQLKPAGDGESLVSGLSGPTADPKGGFLLSLRGYGRSQAAVAKFVLRLEQTGLFRQVKTIKTTREAFLNAEAVAFRLECLLLNRAEVTQP